MSAEFAAAFLAAQREFPTIAKTKTADMGNYKYKYADLGDVLDQALPILHKHGIALSQPPASGDGSIGVHTRLIHESGHIEDCGTLLLPAGNNPQAAGSAMTYARRYAACAALGIVADEDDDGRAAREAPVREEPPVDLAELIRVKVALFKEWTEDERREIWITHSQTVLSGKPQTASEVDQVVKSISEQYYEQFPPSNERPF
jgi:hypothetical protein